MKQLVDLNGDITNFELTFTAKSQDGSPFEALVVDQTTLDSNPSLEYKKAEGTISGNIISDKGVYQNYFLLLKSDSITECDVSIEIKEISERKPLPRQNPKKQQKLTSISQIQGPKTTLNWFIILALVLGSCFLIWYCFFNKKNSSMADNSSSIPSQINNPPESFNLGDDKDLPRKNLLERLSKLEVK